MPKPSVLRQQIPETIYTLLEYACQTIEWKEMGINVDGKFLNNPRFADDIVLIADSFVQAQRMLRVVSRLRLRI